MRASALAEVDFVHCEREKQKESASPWRIVEEDGGNKGRDGRPAVGQSHMKNITCVLNLFHLHICED